MGNKNSWNGIAKNLHWAVALFIVVAATLGFLSENVEMSPGKLELFVWHKSFGITVLVLMLLRLVWRVTHKAPEAPENLSKTNHRLAELGHWAIYLIAILVPLSGWILTSATNFPFNWFGLFEVPLITSTNQELASAATQAHVALFWALAVLVAGHVVMAFKHQFHGIQLLQRILPNNFGSGTVIVGVVTVAALLVGIAWNSSYKTAPVSSTPEVAEVNEPQDLPETDGAGELASGDLAQRWFAVAADSTLGFTNLYFDNEYKGQFERFEPVIYFDPDNLAASRFEVTIDITSTNTYSDERDEMLPVDDWFHYELFPESTYTATQFEVSGDQFLAHGPLNLKGVSQAVTLTFNWSEEGDTATLVGTASVDRRDFGIGAGLWAEDAAIGFEVNIRTELSLTTQQPEGFNETVGDTANDAEPAPAWSANPDNSSLTFKNLYFDNEYEGRFEQFSPEIRFDPNNLAGSAFNVSIDVTSANTDSEERDEMLPVDDWFDYANFPEATYVATVFEQSGDQFIAQGELTLKCITKLIPLTFTWEETDGSATLIGTATTHRREFNIGAGMWEADEGIGFEVNIHTTLELTISD